MTRLGWITFLILVVLIVGGSIFFFLRSEQTESTGVAETVEQDLTGQSIYVSGEYGFTVRYPDSAVIEESFSPSYHLASFWRAGAPANATGTPLLAIIPFETESENSYPRYFSALVRIGVSDDSGEVGRCEKATIDQGETILPEVELNGTTWKAFAFENAGMMQYVRGVSYRTLHEGKCYAVEKIAVGSSYKEDAPSEGDISQEALDSAYNRLDEIIQTVTFSRP